jgi:hypothetical protein
LFDPHRDWLAERPACTSGELLGAHSVAGIVRQARLPGRLRDLYRAVAALGRPSTMPGYLGYSLRGFAMGLFSERLPELLAAHEATFAHFGGPVRSCCTTTRAPLCWAPARASRE